MAWRVTFATLPTGNEPLSALDQALTDAGLLGVIPCTATGTDTIALAATGYTPPVASYADFLRLGFVAAGDSAGSVTINFGGLGAKKLFIAGSSTQAGAGTLGNGEYYEIVYFSALDSAAGGFVIASQLPAGNILDGISDNVGDILYSGSSGWAGLPAGTPGYVLTQGASIPGWAAAPTAAVTKRYISPTPFTPIAVSSEKSEPHGLTVTAFLDAKLILTCTANDNGYVVGDQIVLGSGVGSSSVGITVWVNATNVGYSTMGSGTNSYLVAAKAGGGPNYLDTSKWTGQLVALGY